MAPHQDSCHRQRRDDYAGETKSVASDESPCSLAGSSQDEEIPETPPPPNISSYHQMDNRSSMTRDCTCTSFSTNISDATTTKTADLSPISFDSTALSKTPSSSYFAYQSSPKGKIHHRNDFSPSVSIGAKDPFISNHVCFTKAVDFEDFEDRGERDLGTAEEFTLRHCDSREVWDQEFSITTTEDTSSNEDPNETEVSKNYDWGERSRPTTTTCDRERLRKRNHIEINLDAENKGQSRQPSFISWRTKGVNGGTRGVNTVAKGNISNQIKRTLLKKNHFQKPFRCKRKLMSVLLGISAFLSVVSMFLLNSKFNHLINSKALVLTPQSSFTSFKTISLTREKYIRRSQSTAKSVRMRIMMNGLRPVYRYDEVERDFEESILTTRSAGTRNLGIGEIEPGMYQYKGSTSTISNTATLKSSETKPRIFTMGDLGDSHLKQPPKERYVDLYPTEFSDNTQLYGIRDSQDEALSHMERVDDEGYSSPNECVPMEEWQTAYYPACNDVHDIDMNMVDDQDGGNVSLLGGTGYWRNVWKLDLVANDDVPKDREVFVMKTLRFKHNFEQAHYERDRIDAMAMERLTASPNVINIHRFCGRSVVTEFASGPRIGTLLDKSRKKPLKRLQIARDIASGLADVHGIDGNDNTTFVHRDINLANVVVVDNALKLNDFNVGVMLKWNVTSSSQCGFPTKYPNPQWRSPEEANESLYLTEKIDVFSMGHIFFRMICGHGPWNKLELGGRPSPAVVTEKVKEGKLPHIPDEILHTTNSEMKVILNAMLACYTKDPNERPSAREIADFLDDQLQELSTTKKGKKDEI